MQNRDLGMQNCVSGILISLQGMQNRDLVSLKWFAGIDHNRKSLPLKI